MCSSDLHSAIALDASGPQLLGRLEQLVARVGAQSLRVPPGSRAAYHAASHYGAAFLCVLFEQGMRILDGAGISGDPPRKAVVDHAIRWVEAFAPRSIYLRTAPDRAATIARVIQAEEPVLLGPIVAGWRMARAGGIDGYVAARFFTLD